MTPAYRDEQLAPEIFEDFCIRILEAQDYHVRAGCNAEQRIPTLLHLKSWVVMIFHHDPSERFAGISLSVPSWWF